jgi:hypothetical protein
MSRLYRWLRGKRNPRTPAGTHKDRRMTLNELLDANLKAGRLVYEWR